MEDSLCKGLWTYPKTDTVWLLRQMHKCKLRTSFTSSHVSGYRNLKWKAYLRRSRSGRVFTKRFSTVVPPSLSTAIVMNWKDMSSYGAVQRHSSRIVFLLRIHTILKYICRKYFVRFYTPHLRRNKQLPDKTDSAGIWTMGPNDTRRRIKWAADRNVRTCVMTLWRLLFEMWYHVIC